MKNLRINLQRLLEDLDSLSEIGSTGDGGVHRPALTDAHLAARAWFKGRVLDAGLDFRQDAAGNCSGVLSCGNADAQTVMIGSHLDSVPNGGRFDGALGVLTGLEVLRTIRESGLLLDVHLEVMDFTDEEGTLIGLLGSRALAGILPESDLESPRGGRAALAAGFDRAGITNPILARRDADGIAGYFELHIEQGPRLIEHKADIGVVSALVGIVSYEIEIEGRADHAGTTPMNARQDAGLAASAYMLSAREMVVERYANSVVNFGQCEFLPGAFNIVPASAKLALEFRSPDQGTLDRLEEELLQVLEDVCAEYDVRFLLQRQGCVPPAPCSPKIREAFETAVEQLGLQSMTLFSGAGHDTQAMAAICPAGMIFIPSSGGSHNPSEFASPDACKNGANVILQALLAGWGPQG